MTRLAPAASLALAALLAGASGQNETPDLKGLKLRCRVITEKPSFYKGTDRDGYTGLGVAYLEKLEKALNFYCGELVEYEPPKPPKGSNYTYEGFSGLTRYFNDCAKNGDSSGCDFDMATAGFFETADRLPRVDFPAGYAYDRYSVVQLRSAIENSNLVKGPLLLAPYTFWVWVGIVSIMLTHVLVSVCDVEFLPEEEEKSDHAESQDSSRRRQAQDALLRTRVLRKIRYGLFSTIHSLLGTDDRQTVNRGGRRSPPTRQRILAVIAQFAGLFLILCYEAGLVVQLFAEQPISEFRSINDVKNCRIDAAKFCVPTGGTSEVFWKRVIDSARDDCRKGLREDDQPVYITDKEHFKDVYSAGLNAVKEGKCEYFMAASSTVTVAAADEYCNVLSVVGKPFGVHSVGFVLPKDSNITEAISVATLQIHQVEGMETLTEYGVRENCETSTSSNRLTWSRMKIVFYVTWTLHGLMLAYMYTDRQRRVRERQKEEGNVLPEDEKRFTLPSPGTPV